ncbi:MAG: IF2 family translation initiation factor [Mycolicibacterium neoaurum]|uniref:IF2 family translation initiation factor n=1 Tax=Mycolicibacterium neoaurum TaxID=1795 RepID=UPI002FF800D3
MNVMEVPRTIARAQYRWARIPLQLFEDRVVARFDAEAPARLFYERSVGVLDTLIGHALGDRKLSHDGAALAQRSAARGRAAQLDADADALRRQADEMLQEAREEVVQEREDARAAKRDAVAEAVSDADQRRRNATETAERNADAAARRAADAASQRRESVRQVQRGQIDRIDAAEDAVTADASDKRAAAQAKRADAADKRATADRVEDLAHAEKQGRRNAAR